MATWIKICGLTNFNDAALAVTLGADALGFVLHRPSRRFCTLDVARSVIREFSGRVITVGVWLDESPGIVMETARFVGCQWVQTYSPVTAKELQAAGLNVLPAIPLAGELAERRLWRSFCQTWSGRVMMDRSRSMEETEASSSQNERCAGNERVAEWMAPNRTILAGGLNPATIRSELATHRPAGVDVASGVESHPGRKCPEKLARFIKEVRQWDATDSLAASADNSCPRP